MARLDESTLAALLLTSRLVTDGPPPLKAREFWALVESVGGDPAVLLADDAPVVDDPGRIRGLLGRATTFAFALEDVERSGINIVSAFDPRYPARLREHLGAQAPPALHTVGPVALLSAPSLAIVGSDDDPQANGVGREAAIAAVGAGLTVLTGGGGAGVDAAATAAALAAGGQATGVLADPLTRRIRQPDVRRAIHEGRLCLATPYPPSAPFSAGAAIGRHKIVHALARVTLVVATDQDEGQALAGAAEALARGYGQVAVWRGPGQGPGNEALAKRGALEVANIQEWLDTMPAP